MGDKGRMKKLKPCPFCGDAWIYISDGSYTSGYESFGYKVECRCKGSFMAMSWKTTKEKAIEAWNRRTMARLIDANSILDDFLKRYTGMEKDGKLVFAACEIKQDFADMISNAPTVDAVEVVRCKDCAVPHNKYTGCPMLNGLVTPPDFYCPFGERKEDVSE